MSVVFFSQPDEGFSSLYLEVRKKEQRIFSDADIVKLPDIPIGHTLFDEWQVRKKSARRFMNYLSLKPAPLKILDIGCGNGWFSNLIADTGHEVTAIDVNLPELEQAARVFKKSNLIFAYANIFEKTPLNDCRFDVIVLNSSLQYFSDVPTTLTLLRGLLPEKGEIHILDTPFYKPDEAKPAYERTAAYYEGLGFPEMAKRYFHPTLGDLGKHRVLYKPSFLNFFKKDSPFRWIIIERA